MNRNEYETRAKKRRNFEGRFEPHSLIRLFSALVFNPIHFPGIHPGRWSYPIHRLRQGRSSKEVSCTDHKKEAEIVNVDEIPPQKM